jgi:hypothetical protein
VGVWKFYLKVKANSAEEVSFVAKDPFLEGFVLGVVNHDLSVVPELYHSGDEFL